MLDSSPLAGKCLRPALFKANLTRYSNQLGARWVKMCACVCAHVHTCTHTQNALKEICSVCRKG